MSTKIKIALFIYILLISAKVNAQNSRLNTSETIGWINYFGTLNINKKTSIHSEYQWRRAALINHPQQGLLRFGINYQPNKRILFRSGYAHIETYNYGAIPINGFGKDYTEHRIYEMVQLSHKEAKIEFIHRFMLEQRFVGKYSSPSLQKEDSYPFLNRIRYMFRVQVSLKGTEIKEKIPYLAVYDEIFIGFGKNVAANVFDQNRIGILVGYPFNKHLKIEAGYLNQIVQFGRLINGRNVFQNNQGFILQALINLDLKKQK